MKGFEAGLSVQRLSREVIGALCGSSIGLAEIAYFAEKTMDEQTGDYIEYRSAGGDDLSVWSVHAPFGLEWDTASLDTVERRRVVDALEPSFELAKITGASIVVLHPGLELPVNVERRQERLDACRKSIEELAGRFARPEMRIAVELLPRDCLGNRAEELLYLTAGCDPSSVGMCLDLNHVIPTSRLSSTIRTLGERIITLHVSDHDDVDERHRLPMEGVIDWGEAIRLLTETGYSGPFMYEVALEWKPGNAASNAQRARANYDMLPWEDR